MDFVTWVEEELRIREWSRADLSRKSGIATPQITRVLNREQNAGRLFCEGIARAFDLPIDVVFRNAGLLPPATEQEVWAAKMYARLERLPPDLRDIAETLITALYEKEKENVMKKQRSKKN